MSPSPELVDVVDRGPRAAELGRRRTNAARWIGRIGLGVGGALAVVGGLAGVGGDLTSLGLGLASGALFAAAGYTTHRWLLSLERRAVRSLGAAADGLHVALADGRTFSIAWTAERLGLSAEVSALFPPDLFAVIRIPGVTGLLPGFLVEPERWAHLVEVARRAGAPVADASHGDARSHGIRIGRRG